MAVGRCFVGTEGHPATWGKTRRHLEGGERRSGFDNTPTTQEMELCRYAAVAWGPPEGDVLKVITRPYESGDASATAEIFLRAITEVASRDYTPSQIAAWARVEDLIAWGSVRESRPTWIAEIHGQVVGFADLTGDGLLDMMFVHPQYQGVGVASSLLHKVEAQARAWNMSCLSTEASRTARPFFERRGFRVVRAQQVQKRGETLENFLMEKSLAL